MKLPEKWHKAVEQNSEYVVQIKFLVKMENVSFIFTSKLKELFGQPINRTELSVFSHSCPR